MSRVYIGLILLGLLLLAARGYSRAPVPESGATVSGEILYDGESASPEMSGKVSVTLNP